METKIAVLSDTHLHGISRDLVELYEKHLKDKDMIIHAGDFVSEEVIDFLVKKPFHGVHGNMDPLEVKKRLPEKKIVRVGRFKIGLIHGWGSPKGLEDKIREQFKDVDIIIYGHSHRPENRVKEGVLFFNPGTALGYTSSGMHSIGVLKLGETISGEIIDI
ncbi:MAG: metallophosphoesterase family protein [Deltaproteobacteria bacterium]|nr:metallophosphoesterase family protein [Deltaproteobacteria bacterium]MBW2137092.1 metallophosphoesterase family protein [Deltaproteobacteria bacterium]